MARGVRAFKGLSELRGGQNAVVVNLLKHFLAVLGKKKSQNAMVVYLLKHFLTVLGKKNHAFIKHVVREE